MKICSPQLGMSPDSSLGGEIYDYQTIKGFTKKGIKVFVYLPKNRQYDKTLKNLYVEYCFITHIAPPWIYSFICLPYIFRTYGKEKFDILRIHSPRFLGLAAVIFHLRYPKVPLLTSSVTVDSSPLFYPIEWLVFKISRLIIVQSKYMESFLVKKYYADKRKIAVTYGGQASLLTKPNRPLESLKLKNSDKVLLFMGLLVKRKNPKFLVDVFHKSKKNIQNLKLVIIGSGPEKTSLVKALNKADLLKDTILVDSAYGPEKVYWLNRMNIFVLPSLNEAFGLSATEAMSYAKPVITSDRAAFREIITNTKNGYTLPLSSSVWARTIVDLIKSPSLSKKIGEAARKTAEEKFSWENTYKLNYQGIKKVFQ